MKFVNIAFVLSLIADSAEAVITGATGTGDILGSAAGVNLDNNAAEASGVVQGYDENQCIEVSAGQVITVDFLVGDNLDVGDVFSGVDLFDATNGKSLPEGKYSSHLLHFDPLGAAGTVGTFGSTTANFTFSNDIVGIIHSNSGDAELLEDSDGIFGNADEYDSLDARKTEPNQNDDGSDELVLLASNELGVNRMGVVSNNVDDLRVLTICNPCLDLLGLELRECVTDDLPTDGCLLKMTNSKSNKCTLTCHNYTEIEDLLAAPGQAQQGKPNIFLEAVADPCDDDEECTNEDEFC